MSNYGDVFVNVPEGMNPELFTKAVEREVNRLMDESFMRLFGELRSEAEARYLRRLSQCGAI